jgi:anti-sigma-K factor RskA
MPHLKEKVAEFIFGELSAQEMADAQNHLAQCADCRQQVEHFQTTYAMLKTSHDVEPPRRIMFEFDKPRAAAWIWRWLGPMAASAAVAAAVASFTPRPQSQPQIIQRIVQQPGPAAAAASQPVDYQQMIDDLRAELKKRDTQQVKEFQRVRGEMALWEAYQLKLERDTDSNASQIQLLASNRVRN